MTDHPPTVKYLEIVTNDVDAACELYAGLYETTFGTEDASLGNARTATRPDGALIGIRKPAAAHEQPILRTYVAVEDIDAAVKAAKSAGATVAYPPTKQGEHGSFAIVIHGGVEHGLWQR